MALNQCVTIQNAALILLTFLIFLNLFTLQYIVNQPRHQRPYSNSHDDDNHLQSTSMNLMNTIQQPDLKSTNSDEYKIPRIVHLSWKDENIPEDTAKWVKMWEKTNPDYTVWFWTDASGRKFVEHKFPEILNVYNSYRTAIFKADAMRYMILYEYGGIWADLDVEPLKSMEPIRDKYPAILSQESELHARNGWGVPVLICNAFMATRKRHPYFKFLVDMLEVNQKDNHPVSSTGPMMVTRMHRTYIEMYNELGRDKPWNNVYVASIDMFMPTTDILALERLDTQCKERTIRDDRADLCDKFLGPNYKNGPTNESFADHHWWHSWLGGKDYKKYIPITDVLKNVNLPGKTGLF